MLRTPNLVDAIKRPELLAELDAPGWEKILQYGRQYGISGRWYEQLESCGALKRVPAPVQHHLWSDRLIALENERRVRWEADRVRHALVDLNVNFVLLKGAAYIMQGLTAGQRRLASDLDILVPSDRLDEVETALQAHGWRMKADDEYDERYYREWMHELPPMQHNVRGGWLDVHHNLVPRTSRFYPDARSLLRRAVPISKTGYYSLAPADMLIHSILHGFASGEFLNGFRDILDVHELITDLQDRHEGFWQDFQDRVTELDIGRPAYYALRYAKLFFGTRIPADSLAALSGVVPNALVLVIMDFAVNSMVLRGPQPTMRQRWAGRLLLARSHWIKMPPWMLFKHLARKFSKRRALRADQV